MMIHHSQRSLTSVFTQMYLLNLYIDQSDQIDLTLLLRYK